MEGTNEAKVDQAGGEAQDTSTGQERTIPEAQAQVAVGNFVRFAVPGRGVKPDPTVVAMVTEISADGTIAKVAVIGPETSIEVSELQSV